MSLSRFFIAFAIYYWLLLMLHDPGTAVAPGGIRYALFVVPAAFLVLLAASNMIISKRKLSLTTCILLLLLALQLTLALYRSPPGTVLSVGPLMRLLAEQAELLLLLFFISFAHSRPTIALSRLNYLYLLSVLLSIPVYHLGLTAYGYFPGQHLSGLSQGLAWRVSLFPSLPESAIFSAILLLINVQYRGLPLRRVVLPAAVYFLLLSGLRSAILGTALCLLYTLLLRTRLRTSPRLSLAVLMALLGLLVTVLVQLASLRIDVGSAGGRFLTNYVLRSASQSGGTVSLGSTMVRPWVWQQHIRAMSSSPFLGIGNFDFEEIVTGPRANIPAGATGSESFLTGFLAQAGISALLLPLAVLRAALVASRSARFHVPIGALLFLTLSLLYGSFITPYNFIMFVFAFLIFGQVVVRRDARKPRAQAPA